jgi:hypothetical protein
MNGRLVLGILITFLLIGGAAALGISAYQAGLAQGVVQASDASTVVVPAYGYGYHGWGFGWGFFGFFGFLLFGLLLFGLIRAFVGWGRWGRGGWGPRGGPNGWYGNDRDAKRSHWESRAHDTFEDWHRQAHGERPSADRPAGEPRPPSQEPPRDAGA